ncbi:hypothetical protein H9L39_14784 [Fusarium oxysporum f. sp. albedinis]|nr:hypothetical protein H9L39_14784 [Fusarium oxysporum f. sp. albedinis]
MHTATASFIPSQYASQQETHFIARRNPHPPPSPPMEEQKCPLPSISNLLVLAEASSPTSESSPTSRQHSPRFEGYSSPPRKPSSQTYPGSAPRAYYYETTPPLEANTQHQVPVAAIPQATPPAPAPYTQQPHPSAYANPPLVGAYYPAAQAPPAAVQPPEINPYYQRPPPQAYPPLVSIPAPAPSKANP